ncbi:MAG: Fic family protein [Nanoarchaeota archaeon]|nr:Fic family protein [Nanoarchaeota archaeon]MBU1050933.1 Fic family protein [Nanoarchaeota archaeon]MBU1988470.1 Fic family protein [Nanoarchaeota archaeon]
MVKHELREEIMLKKNKISGDAVSFDARARLVRDSLTNLGDVYSFWIENPDLRGAILMENKSPQTVRKLAQRGIRRLHNAWYFLSHFGRDCDFVNALDINALQGANALVLGRNAVEGRFRDCEVSLKWPEFRPPKPQEIPQRIEDLLRAVKEEYFNDPLDASIYTHLALALTQPFEEGNKRTARLVQNRMLVDYGFPPAVIPVGEAKFYMGLLRKAIPTYQAGKLHPEKELFFDYVASKVNNGLDLILDDLGVSDSLIPPQLG